MENAASTANALPPVGLLRRLAAMVYDGFLLFGVLFCAAALVLLFAVLLLGGAVVSEHNPLMGNPLFFAYLLIVWFLFYGWFWTHGGQTLGMRAWKIRIQRRQGGALSWGLSLRRFLLAILSWSVLGLGYLWMLVDRDGMALHDRLSDTVLVRSKP